MQKLSNGLRANTCKEKNYLACSSTLPTISPMMIKNLGVSFCNMNEEELSVANLHAKTKPTPVSRKPSSSKAVGVKKTVTKKKSKK